MFGAVLLAFALAPHPVFTEGFITLLGSPSPDGAFVSLVEQGQLAVRATSDGRSRRLTAPSEKEFAYFSAVSRDSKSIAYAWFNREGFYELRSIPAAGGTPVTLLKNPEAGFVQPTAWTPDNRFILTLLFRKDNVSQIALIPAAGGPPKVLRSLNWVYPKRMDISPDGKWLVYDSFAPGSSTDRTIFLISLDGATERQLVTKPGNHLFPLFAPDGQSVYYLSNDQLVQQPLEPVEAVARTEAQNLGRILPLGIAGGQLYYGRRTGEEDVFLAPVADSSRAARRVSARFLNRNLAPAFAPDGKRLAYLSRRGTENFGKESRVVVVADLETAVETELAARMAHIETVTWRHDGQALLLSGSDGRGRGGVFEFDLATQRTRPLVAEPGGPPRGYPAVSTRNGIFILNANRVVTADGKLVYEGRNLKSLAATASGELAVYDENAVIFPASGKQIVMSGITELLGGAERLHAIRGDFLVRLQPTQEFPLPRNRQPNAAISPDGQSVALAAGKEREEIWALPLTQ